MKEMQLSATLDIGNGASHLANLYPLKASFYRALNVDAWLFIASAAKI